MRKLITIIAMLMGIIALHGNNGSNIILVEESHCQENGIWIKTVETPEEVRRYEYWIIDENSHWSILHSEEGETYIPRLKIGTYKITRYAFLKNGKYTISNTCETSVQDCTDLPPSYCDQQMQELKDIIKEQRLEIQDLIAHCGRTGGKNPENEIRLYPNPATDYINLDNPRGYNYQLIVSDVNGIQTYEETFNARFIEVPLSKGMNIITLIDDKGDRTTKKIISH